MSSSTEYVDRTEYVDWDPHNRLSIGGDDNDHLRRVNFFYPGEKEPTSIDFSEYENWALFDKISRRFLKNKPVSVKGYDQSLVLCTAITCTSRSSQYAWQKKEVDLSNGGQRQIRITLQNTGDISITAERYSEIEDLVRQGMKNKQRVVLQTSGVRDWAMIDFSRAQSVYGLGEKEKKWKPSVRSRCDVI